MVVFLLKDLQSNSDEARIHKHLIMEDCFYCGFPLFMDSEWNTGGIVAWSGNELIGLHQGCAEDLGVQLIQDARTLVTMTGKANNPETGVEDVSVVWYVQDYRRPRNMYVFKGFGQKRRGVNGDFLRVVYTD